MNNSHEQRLSEVLLGAAEVQQRKISAEMIELYKRLLAEYSSDQISDAVEAHLKDPKIGMFWPSPAHIIGKIKGSTVETLDSKTKATVAWGDVMLALERHGPARKPNFDQVTMQAIQSLGGWTCLCKCSYDELKWKQKTFLEAWTDFHDYQEANKNQKRISSK